LWRWRAGCADMFILQSFVTKFWKTTHMGACEIRISEFSALLFRTENYFWNISVVIRHWKWLETINICTIDKVFDLIIKYFRCQMHPYGWFCTKIKSQWTWLSLPYAMLQWYWFFGIRLLSWLESYHDHHNYCLFTEKHFTHYELLIRWQD